jgi:hypothetical protein
MHEGPRIWIVGNCQVWGFRLTLQALLPDAAIEVHIPRVHPAMTATEIDAELARTDFVISLMLPPEGAAMTLPAQAAPPSDPHDRFEEFDFSRIRQRAAAACLVPRLIFRGFHPDATYLFRDGRVLGSVLGDYHSVLAAAAHVLGLSAKRALRLYNAYVYEELGFFAQYERSREGLLSTFSALGFDLSCHIERWRAGGCFMYTFNHPKVNVLATLATMAAQRLGIVDDSANPPEGLPDPLEDHGSWAIYPEIAARLGISGNARFRRPANAGAITREFDLEELVASSYRLYDSLPPEAVKTRHVVAISERLEKLV